MSSESKEEMEVFINQALSTSGSGIRYMPLPGKTKAIIHSKNGINTHLGYFVDHADIITDNSTGDKQSGFLFLFVGIMSAALLAAVYNRPVSHGISYADSDSITKTNGVTIVLYDKFNVFSTTNLKYYYASNENIKIQHQVNTNMFGNCVGTNVSVVVN